MSKRRQSSANESLAEALSRVMITRDEREHVESIDWATLEGRGDRMPRFLERAINEVPHAARATHSASSDRRYQGSTRSVFRRATYLMSAIAVSVGVGVSYTNPASVSPLFEDAKRMIRAASANITFTSSANAATPRMAFGEALLNYSEQALAQAARANIVVSNLTPGTTLSAGAPVSETAWSLPQADLDNLVITFPTGVSAAAMRATVEIPGNSAASSGKFSVELRQAGETPPVASVTTEEAPTAETPAAQDSADEVAPAKPVTKARSTDDGPKAQKRKLRPSAALAPKQTDAPKAKLASAAPQAKPTVVQVSTNNAPSGSSSPTIFSLLPSLTGASPNALTMFSLGGPVTE